MGNSSGIRGMCNDQDADRSCRTREKLGLHPNPCNHPDNLLSCCRVHDLILANHKEFNRNSQRFTGFELLNLQIGYYLNKSLLHGARTR